VRWTHVCTNPALQVSEQRVEDLLQLARYRKIGRAQKAARPPASFGSELPR
jgi:hypothetical protein